MLGFNIEKSFSRWLELENKLTRSNRTPIFNIFGLNWRVFHLPFEPDVVFADENFFLIAIFVHPFENIILMDRRTIPEVRRIGEEYSLMFIGKLTDIGTVKYVLYNKKEDLDF
jgi:hypothetical protein